MVPPFFIMKKILFFSSILIFVSCFDTPKSKEDIANNNSIITFIQDRTRRDTVLSYNSLYLGMSPEEFANTRYHNLSLTDYDTLIDNKGEMHKVYVSASCYADSLKGIELSCHSYSAEAFNALRDLYISKYGPFSLYRRDAPIAAEVYTVDDNYFYTDLLAKGNDDITGFQYFRNPSFVEYIWCWANCYICLCRDKEGIGIIYSLHRKNSKGEIDSYYFDYIFPQKPKTITDSDKKRLKNSQSI